MVHFPDMTKRTLFFCLPIAAVFIAAQMPPVTFPDGQKIAVQNSILAKVNDATISMIDVKKQMDLVFHQHYSHLSDSSQARYQFYETSWRRVLMELVDNELILSDAADKEISLTDGEIREEMENRFGPSVLSTLEKIGLTYDEAWKLLKNELLVRRMSWWFVHSKAVQSVTPQEIRNAYRNYLKEHPPYLELQYQTITIRGSSPEAEAAKVYEIVKNTNSCPEVIAQKIQEVCSTANISPVYTASDLEISEAHKATLISLEEKTYSAPVLQKSRTDRQTVARIFYLVEKIDHPAPAFQDLSGQLRDELIQKAVATHSKNYVSKLRKHYGFDDAYLKDSFPEDMHPFSIQ